MPSPLEKLFEAESIIGADFHTRIPDAVCRALRLQPDDRLRYRIGTDGRVHLENLSRPATAARTELPSALALVAGLVAAGQAAPQDPLRQLDSRLISTLQALVNNVKLPSDPDPDPDPDPKPGGGST